MTGIERLRLIADALDCRDGMGPDDARFIRDRVLPVVEAAEMARRVGIQDPPSVEAWYGAVASLWSAVDAFREVKRG